MNGYQGDRKDNEPRRKEIRLKDYDYSLAGGYFVTICTHNRVAMFGEVMDGEMRLSHIGDIVQRTWEDLPNHYPGIELGPFVIMPNHIHAIIILLVGAGSKPALDSTGESTKSIGVDIDMHGTVQSRGRAGLEPAPTEGRVEESTKSITADDQTQKRLALSEVVCQLKTFSARRINSYRKTPGQPVWQRNYWEHVIRSEAAYDILTQYILANPANWNTDQLHNNIEAFHGRK